MVYYISINNFSRADKTFAKHLSFLPAAVPNVMHVWLFALTQWDRGEAGQPVLNSGDMLCPKTSPTDVMHHFDGV